MSSDGCDLAHGDVPAPDDGRRLVAVFDSRVAENLLHFAEHVGYSTVLLEPADGAVADMTAAGIDANTDVVVTDHHREEFGPVLRDALTTPARWIGVMGSPRHDAPHVPALRELGVDEADIARVHRPIGLNIGSRTPPEIALATLAGLLADRAGKPGGFDFGVPTTGAVHV
jgi:xanthine dehydrogenase accessory factor